MRRSSATSEFGPKLFIASPVLCAPMAMANARRTNPASAFLLPACLLRLTAVGVLKPALRATYSTVAGNPLGHLKSPSRSLVQPAGACVGHRVLVPRSRNDVA